MKQSLSLKAFLVVAGIIGCYVGFGLLFYPVSFEASAGLVLDDNVSLLSELRGIGGTLLLAGILIFSGAFVPWLTSHSLFLTVLIYLAYGLSRVYGMLTDGMPSQAFIGVTVAELAIGLLAIAAYYRFKKRQPGLAS